MMVESWWEIIFNPSFPYRLSHMVIASLLTSAFLVAGVSAYRILNNVEGPGTWRVLKTGIVMAVILAPLQIFVGDLHGLNTLKHQPAKIAAIEAIWKTESGVGLSLFGFPDEEEKTTHFNLEIPRIASLILTHDLNGELKGLNEFEGVHPPVSPLYWAFRIMVAIGMMMLCVSWYTALSLWRGIANNRVLLRVLTFMTYSGWVAVLAGWYVTEIGRQPWIVYGVLRTADMVADHSGGLVLSSLIAYLSLYAFLLVSYLMTIRYMASKPARSLTTLQQRAQNEQSRSADSNTNNTEGH